MNSHKNPALSPYNSDVLASEYTQFRPATTKKERKVSISKEPLQCSPLRDKLGNYWVDSDSSEDEGMADYKTGGYYAVHVGEVLRSSSNRQYIIVQKLGWGHFSTVWLAKDLQYDSWVAIKVQKSAPHYIEAAYDEVGILEQVSSFWKKKIWIDSIKKYYKDDPLLTERIVKGIDGQTKVKGNLDESYCVQLLDGFIHPGANGNHYIMVFEIMGVNLLEIIKRYDYKGIPIPLVRVMAKQCLMGLDYLHRVCNLIHTDLKPENIILELKPDEIREIKDKQMLSDSKVYKNPSLLEKIQKFNVLNIKRK